MIGIRWHGRGGQGAVTSAELLAQAAIDEGKYAQAFPSFGPERRGAPVQAFNRICNDKPIRIRAGIASPDVVVVLDSGLINIVNVTSGLKGGGILVINTRENLDNIIKKLGADWSIAAIDATSIARELLGVPIVNTTMLGTLVRATGIVKLESLFQPLEKRFGRLAEKNKSAMQKAFQDTMVKEI
ncbi:MAG TPA: pyruvate synthase [Dehalococcoidia bacterium]|nr:pyruvate synthase [Dehalococcoidia bacterium]